MTARSQLISFACSLTKSQAARSAITFDARYFDVGFAAIPFSSTSRGACSFQCDSSKTAGVSRSSTMEATEPVMTMRLMDLLGTGETKAELKIKPDSLPVLQSAVENPKGALKGRADEL